MITVAHAYKSVVIFSYFSKRPLTESGKRKEVSASALGGFSGVTRGP